MKDYVELTKKTNSGPEFARQNSWGDRDSLFKAILCTALAGDISDHQKALMFYGKLKSPVTIDRNKQFEFLASNPQTNLTNMQLELIHGILGVSSELTELCQTLHYPSDEVNIKEELGDILWYVGIMANQVGATMEELMEMNIAKLKARYGDKFTSEDATSRDLVTERAALEGTGTAK